MDAEVVGLALPNGEVVTGRGIGLGTHHVSYGAAVADIEVNRRTGVIVAKRLLRRARLRPGVNPASVEAQIVGQMIQATSRTLKEEVLFDQRASPAWTGSIRCCASPTSRLRRSWFSVSTSRRPAPARR